MNHTNLSKHTQMYIEMGYNIAYYRKHANLTQEQLAEIVNVSRSHISAIEAPNIIRPMSIQLFFDIAAALNVEPYKLLKIHD